MAQSMLSSGMRRNCGSCGIGKMLALFMLVGLFYLTLLHSSAQTNTLKALQKLGVHGSDEERLLLTIYRGIRLCQVP